MRKWITLAVLGLAAAMTVGALNLHAADTIKIGVVAPLTGPAAETGSYQIKGAKLAVEEINKAGGVLGKPVELIIEDDQTTNPGIIMAFSKLAGNKDIVGFLGSIRSTQVNAMSPDAIKVGKPVMIGGTDPDTHPHGQSVVLPHPAERFLFGPSDRRLWSQDPRQEEVGHCPFDRRLRHRRHEGAGRKP